MTIITRFVAAAALLSVALVSPVDASAAELYKLAHRDQHTGGSHHAGRAIAISERQNELQALGARSSHQKRCKPKSSSVPTTHTTHHTTSTHPATTSHKPTTSAAAVKNEDTPEVKPKPKPSEDNNSGGLPSKRIIPWSDSGSHLKNFKSSKVKMIYTWGATCPPEAAELGFTCVSMLWGHKNVPQFKQARNSHKYLAGMNEWNIGSQSEMSVYQAVAMWNANVRPLGNQGHYLVSPVLASTGDSVQLMNKFLDLCGGNDMCGFDAIAVHCYSTTAEYIIQYVTKMYEGTGKKRPIWLTEFNCIDFSHGKKCSHSQSMALIQGVSKWADETEWVHMYGPWGFSTKQSSQPYALMTSSGHPTDIAQWFLNH